MSQQEWIISHPGTGKPIECKSFLEAYDKYFEGFNLPHLFTDGVMEPFESAYQRVSDHLKSKRKTSNAGD